MEPEFSKGDPTVQVTSIQISAFGVRTEAEGVSVLEAWRIIRRRHPWAVWVLAGYAAVFALIVALGIAAVVF